LAKRIIVFELPLKVVVLSKSIARSCYCDRFIIDHCK